MQQFFAYHKAHNQPPYHRVNGSFWASTNAYGSLKANQMLGSRMWIVQSEGKKPYTYSIVACFTLETINEIAVPAFRHTFTGRNSVSFDPGIEISNCPWFDEFRVWSGNFQRMRNLREKDVENFEAMTDLVRLAEADDSEAKELYASFAEGMLTRVLVNRYERSPEARHECIKVYGAICSVCELDFEQRYGKLGRGCMHVHHLKAISACGGEYKIDPVNDLRPVCPNCHAMLHRRKPHLSIEELKAILRPI